MTTAIEPPVKRFAVAHEPEAKKPYIVRTTEAEFAFTRKIGSSKKIMELIEAGYTLDQTGQTRPAPETHRSDPSTLTRVSTFDYLGFACRIGYDRETCDWLMEVDGQPIGYARTEDEGATTIRTHCEEVARHTRATTADMAADAAEAQGETNEPAPPRTVSELQDELDAVTNAILGVKRGTDAWDRLDRMRKQIVIELNEAHRHRTGICHCGSLAVTPGASLCPFHAAIEAVSGTRCPSCGDPLPHCPCGAPATWQVRESGGVYYVACDTCYQRDFARNERRVAAWEADSLTVCSACRESGEGAPYVALGEDPENAAAVSGACRACGGAHHIQACDEVRALLSYDKGAGTGGNPVITVAVPSEETIPDYIARKSAEERARIRAACEAADEAAGDTVSLTRMAADDPCADVRARLGEENKELRRLLADHHLWIECALKALQHWMAPVTFDAASKLLQD